MNECRNIVIITGRNVVGKTVASNYLRDWCFSKNIPHANEAISDAQSLLEAMQLDDRLGGFHHTHDWCEATEYNKGHSHRPSEAIVPFTVIGNKLPETMFLDFFTNLKKIPRTSSMYFVEWAGGSNIHPANTSAFETDYSYAKVKRMLQEGSLPTDWLAQVHSVIHIITSDDHRFVFNEERRIPSLEEMQDGTASWQIERKVLKFYGYDDFSEIEVIFRDMCIPIHEVTNDGSNYFFEMELSNLANKLFISNSENVTVGELNLEVQTKTEVVVG